MQKKSLLKSILLGLLPVMAFANGGGFVQPSTADPHPWFRNFYVGGEAGYSISTRMNFQPDYDVRGSTAWITFNHSVFDTDMNTSPLFGGLIGYSFNRNVSVDLTYDYRGQYKWDRLSTLDGTAGVDPANQVGERYQAHDISIQTLLLGINLSPNLSWLGLTPYATAGVGVAWNKIGSFQNSDIPSASRNIPQTFNTLVSGRTKTNFAWKIGAGVDYACPWYQSLHFNLGYRFVDVGTLETGTRFVDTLRNRSGTINPFKANHVQFNEVLLGASYHFS